MSSLFQQLDNATRELRELRELRNRELEDSRRDRCELYELLARIREVRRCGDVSPRSAALQLETTLLALEATSDEGLVSSKLPVDGKGATKQHIDQGSRQQPELKVPPDERLVSSELPVDREGARQQQIDQGSRQRPELEVPSDERLASSELPVDRERARQVIAPSRPFEQQTLAGGLVEGSDTTIWRPDSLACELCSRHFTLVQRRHHCRFCGRCVCNTCSPFRLLSNSPLMRPHTSRTMIPVHAPCSGVGQICATGSFRGSFNYSDGAHAGRSPMPVSQAHRACCDCAARLGSSPFLGSAPLT